MTAVQDWFWGLLGVKPPVSAEEVQVAFKRRAISMHPDHGGSDEEFQELCDARDKARAALSSTRIAEADRTADPDYVNS